MCVSLIQSNQELYLINQIDSFWLIIKQHSTNNALKQTWNYKHPLILNKSCSPRNSNYLRNRRDYIKYKFSPGFAHGTNTTTTSVEDKLHRPHLVMELKLVSFTVWWGSYRTFIATKGIKHWLRTRIYRCVSLTSSLSVVFYL